MKYHGNYCGPYWSDGRRQKSVARGTSKPIDAFDRSCQRHDSAYATGADRKEADYQFYKENIGRGVKRSVAAIAVGAQGLLR